MLRLVESFKRGVISESSRKVGLTNTVLELGKLGAFQT